MSHTLGPWEITKQNGDGLAEYEGLVGIAGPPQTTKAGKEITLYVCQYVEPKNARLIAAAPDLLEALQRIVSDDKEYPLIDYDLIVQANAAIAKATGGA